ncbi:DUF4384 domain-containing protein [Microcoleus sp. FACHB-831]|uniref:DUF4384 domain-containing protein n=1 Tax=Microcoleus sp. FACHB-831 TaxID=2692827 RepID=UPI0016856BB7|nr:DUF4384 domain-containing protein [Microcoleus sp. FACHB-831]MBD1922431.1 DUF4384 domain-containing protein [Microcoleus sp. FACHB-831]
MNLPRYEDYEGEFLDAMATRFGFTGKNSLIFEKRFLEDNREVTHEGLVANSKFAEKLIEGTKNGDAARIFRQQLAAICDKLEAAGCPPPSNGDSRWANAKCWLREVVFPQWAKEQGLVTPPPFTIDKIWQQLKTKAIDSNLLEVVIGKELRELPTLGNRRNNSRKSVPLNSDIKYQVKVEREGYLILLEREPSGVVCCLCPSEYAPNSRCATGVMVLPQYPPSPYSTFGSDEVGREQILAVITQKLPPIDWLKKSKDEALELDRDHLYGLLEYVEGNRDCQVLWTEYSVV